MADLISRAAARDVINTWDRQKSEKVRMGLLHRDLDAIPAVDAAPVVHGHWKDNGNGTVSCSRCATWFQKEREPYLLYCGYCGAKMDRGTEL